MKGFQLRPPLTGSLCLLAALLWLPAASTASVIYRYVDENGVIHLTNIPADGRYQPMGSAVPPGRSAASGAVKYDHFIRTAARQFGLDPLLVKAVIKAESHFDPRAVSKKGAQGLMQLMPETARDLRVRDPFDPQENIRGGTEYLRRMLDLFNDDLHLALAAYNAGPNRVLSLGRVPRIPETEQYIQRVLLHYRQFKTSSPGNLVTVVYD